MTRPDWLDAALFRLRSLVRDDRLDADAEEELRLHLERMVEANRLAGMNDGEAWRDALARYLDEPLRLFIPARFMLAIVTVIAASLIARVTSVSAARGLPLLILATVIFVFAQKAIR